MIVSICALLGGWALQQFLQPTPQQLEVQASAAWNAGDVQSAEMFARRALFQMPESTRACDVLIQVARHDGRPDLQAAATQARSLAMGRELDGQLAAGDIAISNNLLRLAQHYWEAGLLMKPDDIRLHQRLTALAGMQLDFQSMQDRLLAWSEVGLPEPDLVLLYLGLPSVNERDASAAVNLLMAAVEADQVDGRSRLGLGRCLFAMNKFEACAAVLDSEVGESHSFHAAALAVAGRRDEAEKLLQASSFAANVAAGPQHFALGVVAGMNEEWGEAESQFALAVKERPLSRPFRSRYCETLRRNGSVDRYDEEVAKLELLRELIDLAASGFEESDVGKLTRLSGLCTRVGALKAAEILSRTLP